ncbi:MAG: nucleotidyltransferase domain-containing protein, partial [Actinomycetota bacterium]
GDLDLLVRPRQLQAARGVLTREGYLNEDGWDSYRQRAYEHFGHHYGYYHPRKCVKVEVHWRVMPRNVRFDIEDEAFWAHMSPCTIAGAQLPCSPPEDLLLMLTAHGSRHRWERLAWLCDIAALLRAFPALDWRAVERRARELGGVRMLDLGLLLARDVLGAQLPPAAAARLDADPIIREIGADVQAMLFSDIDFEAAVVTRWRYFLRLRERLPHQLSYVIGQTVNSLFWRVFSWGRTGSE